MGEVRGSNWGRQSKSEYSVEILLDSMIHLCMMHIMIQFGKQIADLRKKRELSQAQLATAAGVSQATISRLESADECPTDFRLLSKISKALEEPLAELLPPGYLQEALVSTGEQVFAAYCPNPLCEENKHGIGRNGEPFIEWSSSQMYAMALFGEINYCDSCGTELVKECPNCKRRFAKNATQFCRTCGERVCERPTQEEWNIIKSMHDNPIPF
jgi:transcriptional regulator with XRE-family HTH domain